MAAAAENSIDELVIQVSSDEPGWQECLPDAEQIIGRALRTGMARVGGVSGAAEVSVLLTSDKNQRALNRRWRGVDGTTNVLSFPQGETGGAARPRLLGDVSLALGVIAEEAARETKPIADHLAHLAIHGLLHLLGYDHETESEATAMEALEVAALADLGIADPYALPQNEMGDSDVAQLDP